jgi:hypothetical protein
MERSRPRLTQQTERKVDSGCQALTGPKNMSPPGLGTARPLTSARLKVWTLGQTVLQLIAPLVISDV